MLYCSDHIYHGSFDNKIIRAIESEQQIKDT